MKSVTAILGLAPTPRPPPFGAAPFAPTGGTAPIEKEVPPVSNPFADPAILLLDGAMGTMLQAQGLPPAPGPSFGTWKTPPPFKRYTRPMWPRQPGALCQYLRAYAPKLANTGRTVEEVVAAGVSLAKAACQDASVQVALDLGPLGAMLEPLGALSFEEAIAFLPKRCRRA